MSAVYADRSRRSSPWEKGSTGHGAQRTSKRGEKPRHDPLNKAAKMLADVIWERANTLAKILAPENPVDQEPLTDFESWMILEGAAISINPATWNDPEALQDLYELRKQFIPELAFESLKTRAAMVAKENRALPDPSITPVNPEFEKRIERIGRL